jgi:hypothetical protein
MNSPKVRVINTVITCVEVGMIRSMNEIDRPGG